MGFRSGARGSRWLDLFKDQGSGCALAMGGKCETPDVAII